jgi:hypothetical protein
MADKLEKNGGNIFFPKFCPPWFFFQQLFDKYTKF